MEDRMLIITTKQQLMDCLKELNQNKIGVLSEDKEDKILNREEVASLLEISLGTLNSWMQRGVIEYSKIGHRVFFSKKDVLDAIKAKKRKT
ncbi:helix-turn-helix domain-containing protein [Catalinimonas sp. 4WD22]|uniref:helix-turn-helix domain-containing protein n=1 Tax=Catalinimonas locisalis TaxID=3133978 RepID=UPI0031014759